MKAFIDGISLFLCRRVAFAAYLLAAVPAIADQLVDTETPSNCSWAVSAVVPIPILDSAVAAVGNNLFTFSGASNDALTANCYKFDGTTWTLIAPYPGAPVELASAVSDGTSIYIMNGARSTNDYSTDVFRYDPATNTYTPLASNAVGTFSQTAVFLNGKIYKMGGNAGSSQTALEIYNLATNTWAPGAPLPTPAGFASSWVQGNFVYIAGGINAANAGMIKTYRYDPAANTWSDAAIADLPASRWGAAGAFYNDSVVLAGGYVGGDAIANISTSAIYYNVATDTWTALPSMLGERARMGGAVLGGSFYVVGGRSIAIPFFGGTNLNQKLTCQFAPVPQLAVSRKTHGGAGTFDINLPLTGTFGVDCRRGSGVSFDSHQVVVTFANPVTVGGVTVMSSDGLATGTASVAGAIATVTLSSVTDAQTIVITLTNVTVGTNTGDVSISMGLLRGDTTGDRFVNSGDALQTRNRSGQGTDATNFRSDANTDGLVNSGDVTVVRGRAGNFLP